MLFPYKLGAMDKRIIVNADDFGLCEGVNKGIAQAHKEGVLTSTTIMAGMPAAKKAVKLAKKLPKLGVGVHLTLTEGKPVSNDDSVKWLVNSEGEFRLSPSKIALLSALIPNFRKAIIAELSAQIQWVIDQGIKPTHLDSHKHIHTFPVLYSIICQLAREFQIPIIRWAFEPKTVSKLPWPLPSEGGAKRAAAVRVMAFINRMQNSDFIRTDGILGVAHTGRIDVNFFKAVGLYNRGSVVEIMTHPGFVDGLDPSKTRLLKQREAELEAVCSERTKQFFEQAGVKLVHYGQL